MDAESVDGKNASIGPSPRPALEQAAQVASIGCMHALPPEMLREALRTGTVPAYVEHHISTLLEKAPLSMLWNVAAQISAEAGLQEGQAWFTMLELASQLKITRDISVPAMLMEVQAKDEADVAAGRRSARSLWAVQPGDLDGYTFTPNPNSEYDKPGEGW